MESLRKDGLACEQRCRNSLPLRARSGGASPTAQEGRARQQIVDKVNDLHDSVNMVSELDRRVDAVRRFNRFWTRQIGVLTDGVLDSPLSLTDVRVLYELAHRDGWTAAELRRELGLDAGYLSRILRRFAGSRLIARAASPADGRQRLLTLTARGRAVFDPIEARQRDEVAGLLRRLPDAGQREVIAAMRTIHDRVAPAPRDASFLLRPQQPGDIGWVVERHGAFYAAE